MTKGSSGPGTYQPRDRAEWRKWLEENHDRSSGIWLVMFKKSADHHNLSLDEAVEEALCFGWIDSRLNRIDDERFKLRMTPRRPDSIWSKSNKRRVEKLIKGGLMAPAGMAKVDAAKKNGTWTALDDVESMVVPPDLMERLNEDPGVKRQFLDLSPSHKMQYLYWITEAKRAETRSRRIEETIRRIREGSRQE